MFEVPFDGNWEEQRSNSSNLILFKNNYIIKD